MVRLQAEYNSTTTDNNNLNNLLPAFNNKFSGWYAGATLRASASSNEFLKNLELGARLGGYTPPQFTVQTMPKTSPWLENDKTQTTVCLTYWFTWKVPLNIAYDVIKETDGATVKTFTTRLIYFF